MIACIGELLSEREAGKTTEVVSRQLKAIAGTVCHSVIYVFVLLIPVLTLLLDKIDQNVMTNKPQFAKLKIEFNDN